MTYHIHHISFYNVTRHATTWKIPFLKQGPRSLCPSPSHAWVSRPTSPAGHRKSEPNRLANLTNRPDGQSLSGSVRAWWLGHPGMIQKGRQQFLWDITDITQQPPWFFAKSPKLMGNVNGKIIEIYKWWIFHWDVWFPEANDPKIKRSEAFTTVGFTVDQLYLWHQPLLLPWTTGWNAGLSAGKIIQWCIMVYHCHHVPHGFKAINIHKTR